MSHTEAPISINLKTSAGTQLTLRANTPDEFTALTSGIFQIAEAIEEVEKAVRSTGSSASAATPINPAVGYATQALGGSIISEQFTPAAAPAGGGQRMCPHGTMTRIYGMTGKFGPYKGHFCPAQQGDPSKCATQYVKANTAEFAVFVADQTKQ
jgi:hypothetical protein